MKYLIRKINEQMTMISESEDGVHMFLLEGRDRTLLIDTGTGGENIRKCVRKLTNKPLIVLNTHGHYDHMGGNYLFEKVYLHPADRKAAEAHQDPEYLSDTAKKMMPPLFYFLTKLFRPYLFSPHPFHNFKDLSDGQVISLGDRDVEVLHTPGHSMGSVCLLDHKYNLMFTGDSICMRLVMLGCMDFCDRPENYIASMQKLKGRLNADTMLYSNHHENPVPVEYLDKYMACARKIMETPELGITVKYGKVLWNVMEYEDVKMTFDKDGRMQDEEK